MGLGLRRGFQTGLRDIGIGDAIRIIQTPGLMAPQMHGLLDFTSDRGLPNVLDRWVKRLHPADQKRLLDALAAHLTDRSGRAL